MKLPPETFKDRLLTIAAGRKLTPWLMALGWIRTDVARVNKGHVPGPEKLAALATMEHVNLSWLLAGVGEPWIGTREDDVAYSLLTPTKRALIEELKQIDDGAVALVVNLLKSLKKAKAAPASDTPRAR